MSDSASASASSTNNGGATNSANEGASQNTQSTNTADNNANVSNTNQQSQSQDSNQNQAQNQNQDQSQTKDNFDGLYDDKKDDPQNSVVPEKYVFTDENGQQYSDEDTAEFSQFVRDVGLSQEQATKVFNAYVADVKQMAKDFMQGQTDKQLNQKKEWKQAVMSDAEIGGQNFETTKANIAKAMKQYGSDELRQYLNESGLGYNPAFIRFMANIGKNLASDNQFINGATARGAETDFDRAKRLYPNTPEVWGKQ